MCNSILWVIYQKLALKSFFGSTVDYFKVLFFAVLLINCIWKINFGYGQKNVMNKVPRHKAATAMMIKFV